MTIVESFILFFLAIITILSTQNARPKHIK
jgi:hypothetical protein